MREPDVDPDASLRALHAALGRWLRTGRKRDLETRAAALRELNALLDEARYGVQENQREIILDLKGQGSKNRDVADLLGFASISRLDQIVKRTRNQSQTPPRTAK